MFYKYIVERYVPSDGVSRKWTQIFAVVFAAFGFFSTGATHCWTSPSIPILISNASHMDVITLEEASYLTVIPAFASILVCPLCAVALNYLGRKLSILLMILFHIATWLVAIFANDLIALYISRAFQGVAYSFMAVAVPVYIAEVAEPKVRSCWGNAYTFFGIFGQFAMNTVGAFFSIPTAAFVMVWFPISQFFLMILMPESPYFYIKRNNARDAEISLNVLRWTKNVGGELNCILNNMQERSAKRGTFKDLFCNPTNRKALLVGFGVRVFQILTGLQTLFAWTQYIFMHSVGGFSSSDSAIIYTGVFTVILTIFNFFTGKFGRIPLMTLSSICCSVSLTVISVYFYLDEKTNVDVSFLHWTPLVGMILYIPSASIGVCTIPSIMCGELFDLSVKEKAICFLNMVYFLTILIANKLFHVLFVNFGMYLPFGLFALFCLICALYFYCCVPETWGKSLEEIQAEFRGNVRENE